eukprot:7710-Chlamydomonas_euryale.AAC.4
MHRCASMKCTAVRGPLSHPYTPFFLGGGGTRQPPIARTPVQPVWGAKPGSAHSGEAQRRPPACGPLASSFEAFQLRWPGWLAGGASVAGCGLRPRRACGPLCTPASKRLTVGTSTPCSCARHSPRESQWSKPNARTLLDVSVGPCSVGGPGPAPICSANCTAAQPNQVGAPDQIKLGSQSNQASNQAKLGQSSQPETIKPRCGAVKPTRWGNHAEGRAVKAGRGSRERPGRQLWRIPVCQSPTRSARGKKTGWSAAMAHPSMPEPPLLLVQAQDGWSSTVALPAGQPAALLEATDTSQPARRCVHAGASRRRVANHS